MPLVKESYFPTADCWPLLLQAVRTWAAQQQPSPVADWSALWLVLPSHAHIHLFQRLLRQALGPIIPPRCFTLETLAEDIGAATAPAPISEDARLLTVYTVLRAQPLLQKMMGAQSQEDAASTTQTNLWRIARQLLSLCDELSLYLPATANPLLQPAQLEHFLQQHFGPRATLLTLESRLLLTVWQALHDQRSPVAVQLARLVGVTQQLANWQCQALWVMALEPLPPVLAAWLSLVSEQHAVRLWLPAPAAAAPSAEPWSTLLSLAWPEWYQGEWSTPGSSAVEPALVRAQAFATRMTQPAFPPLPWQIVACQSLEEEALTATRYICAMQERWLAETEPVPRQLLVVAQDVVVARRTQALLTRKGLVIRDETGWKLSTTAAATILMRWLEALTQEAPWTTVLDFLKSPFMGLLGADERAELIQQADACWRQTQTRQGWQALSAALSTHTGLPLHAQTAFKMLADTAAKHPTRATLSAHLQALFAALECLGVTANWLRDAAGLQLWQALQKVYWDEEIGYSQAQPTREDLPLSVAEFRAWLDHFLETHPFIPPQPQPLMSDATLPATIDITFVSLAGARLRPCDALVILGGGATVLQAGNQELFFFGEQVRRELGLPTRALRQASVDSALCALFASQRPLCCTWRAQERGEPLALAAPLARLDLFCRLVAAAPPTAGQVTGEGALLPPLVRAYVPELLSQVSTPRMGAAIPMQAALLPQQVSAQAWEKLVACPYRYWAQSVWRLAERADIAPLASPRDYGAQVHQILEQAHQQAAQSGRVDAPALAKLIPKVAATLFNEWAKHFADAFIWAHRFGQWLPYFLDWWSAAYTTGWRWQASEQQAERHLDLGNGQTLRLYGRLDRIDANPVAKEWRVLDYKTQRGERLREKAAQPGEDVQLLFYGLLLAQKLAAEGAEARLWAAYLPASLPSKKPTAAQITPPPVTARTGAAHNPTQSETTAGLRLYAYSTAEEDPATEFAALLAAEEKRLATVWTQLQAGAALPAHGIPAVCEYCEVSGLCRRRDWSAP
ncbi:PD-(D/E)XK nuclease family protein [Parvibium lacunae]|uniref:PD-(D/E)XK nuclease family protein n=1 Tax=Parvibium lacunae TaxID=1888893 RepID=A0A368L3C3_9BURK|nr:PD-(D/E)XK nuclease family protein [Parvibium lacunae]RCS58077.1 PD-(D/E)XK nuclease family protein [Parvibium lacunae]